MRIVETDNFGGDYPNESFLALPPAPGTRREEDRRGNQRQRRAARLALLEGRSERLRAAAGIRALIAMTALATSAPCRDLSDPKQTVEVDGVLYHVTRTEYVPDIRARGLLTNQPHNWAKASDPRRYGNGEVHAFEHELDAHHWAFHMEWMLFNTSFSGRVSIVRFRGAGTWRVDINDPLSQMGNHGRWLKRKTPVPPAAIGVVTAFTKKAWKDWR